MQSATIAVAESALPGSGRGGLEDTPARPLPILGAVPTARLSGARAGVGLRSCLAVGLAALACCGLGTAGDVPDSPPIVRHMSIDDCVREALLHNRDLQIERFNPRIAYLALDAAQGIYDPVFAADTRRLALADTGGLDPDDLSRDQIYDAVAVRSRVGLGGLLPTGLSYSLSGDYADTFGYRDPLNVDSYNLSAGISIRQPLLRDFWIDQPRLTIRINRKNVRITEWGVIYRTMEVVNQVHQAYYDLALARQNVRVREKLLEVRQRFEAEAQQQVAVGRLPSLEVKLAEAQTATAEVELLAARQAVALAANQLKAVLGDDFKSSANTRLEPTDALAVLSPTLSLEQSWQRGLRQRPDLAQMRLDLDKANLDLKYRHNQLFPRFDFVAGYSRRGSDTAQTSPALTSSASFSSALEQIADGVAPNDMIGAIFSMPLSRARERANYRSSQEVRDQFRVRIKQREELVLREIDDAYRMARSAYDRVQATRKAVEFAQAAVAAEEQKLAAGRSTPFVVLSLQGNLANAQSTEWRARAECLKACAQLEFAEASILERHQIQVERSRP
jgi:outer membrane protein TolC